MASRDTPCLPPIFFDRGRRFRRLLKAAGLPATRKDQFHSIRRTTASYIKAAGGDATWQLGHSGPKVTEVYYDPRIVQRARQVDLLPRPSVPPA